MRKRVRRIALASVVLACAVAGQADANEATYDAAVRADAPWGYWKLNESGNPASDASGNGRNFVYSAYDMSKMQIGSAGLWNKGLHFTGYGSITNPGSGVSPPQLQPPITGTYSAEVWFRLGPGQSGSSYFQVLYAGTTYRMDVAARVYQGQMHVISGTDWAGWRAFGPRVDDGNWHQFAYTRTQGSQVAVYIDGSLVGTSAASTGAHGGTILAFGNYQGGSSGVDGTIDGAAFFTRSLSASRVAAHYSHDGAPPALSISGPLYDRRNQSSDHRKEGLYAASYDLQMSASDGTALDPDSGVERLEVFVDGQSRYVKTQSCVQGGCPMSATYTLRPDDFSDGNHAVSVVARDRSGKQATAPTFTVTVDRRGDIAAAGLYDGEPAQGGLRVEREWGRAGTQVGRLETARFIATRSTVPCDDANPSGAKCDETRLATRSDSSPDSPQDYEVTRGSSTADPALQRVASILSGSPAPGQAPAATGAIESAAAPWQHLPPAHGTQFERYDVNVSTDDGGAYPLQVWLDATTKMPIKSSATPATGQEWRYFDYEVGRLITSEVPSDFFSAPRPASVDGETHERHYGGTAPGPQRESEGDLPFTPYWAGFTPTVAGSLCLASIDRLDFSRAGDSTEITEPDAAVDLETPGTQEPPRSTFTDATYYPVANAAGCVAGAGEAESPELEVVSLATASTSGRQWTEAYQDAGETVQLDPLNPDFARAGIVPVNFGSPSQAYVVVYDDERASALVAQGDTTVIVTGRFDKSTVQTVLNQVVPR